ncbi:MAG: hypothetical protein ACRC80_15740 [Waterburya sp.]
MIGKSSICTIFIREDDLVSMAWVLLFLTPNIELFVTKLRRDDDMKPMIWHPEPQDQKVNQYLDQTNHEPWLAIVGVTLMVVCSFTFVVLLGTF